MAKICVVSIGFMNFSRAAENAIKKLGHEVELIEWSPYPSLKEPIEFLKYGYFKDEKVMINRRNSKSKEAIKKIQSYGPNLVLVIFGNQVSVEFVQFIVSNYPSVLLLKDNTKWYPYLLEIIPYFPLVISYEKKQTDLFLSKGYNAIYIPESFNDSDYYNSKYTKEYDICFVGAPYKNRREVINKLINAFPDKKIVIGGRFFPRTVHPIKYMQWRYLKQHKEYLNRNLSSNEVNELYNKSKIVLNLITDPTINGWGSRLLEILATGSFELCYRNEAIETSFGDCLGLYDCEDEIVEKVAYYLEHEDEREQMALKGCERANEFTETKRMQKILSFASEIWGLELI